MFGTSGIRGRVGEAVTADLALSVGQALPGEGYETVVVGRDARETGPFLLDALAAGICECGGDVIDVGVVSTPTLARSVDWFDADAGAIVTASHNPPADNGIKLWTPSGQAFDAARRAAIVDRIESDAASRATWDAVGQRRERESVTLLERHVEAITAAVSEPGLDLAELSVVVDSGTGTGAVTADALYELGCHVRTLNAQPDGRFPARPSEPNAETLSALCAFVRSTDASFGVAHDGDADRMVAVDERGEFVPLDVLLAIFARDAADEGDRVAAPLNTSLCVDDVLAPAGASVVRTRVGDVHVAERAVESDVVFGGEPSGAWIWPEETLCPDGPLAACRLATIIARRRSLGEMVDAIETYPIRRSAIEVEEKDAVMDRIETRLQAEEAQVDDRDGLRIERDDGWMLVRPSGTESVIRVTAEARTAGRADDRFEEMQAVVHDAIE